MTTSYTLTESQTFTIAHAKYITSKVATDLHRFQRFYGQPDETRIANYEAELAVMIKGDYLDHVTYGFKRGEQWVEALRYRVLPGGTILNDDDPGGLRPIDLTGLQFGSYMVHSNKWHNLTDTERQSIEATLPFKRGGTAEPTLENGQWITDSSYSAGGRGLGRSKIIR
jgi:hypothetical protein